jgi:hypothetical protein
VSVSLFARKESKMANNGRVIVGCTHGEEDSHRVLPTYLEIRSAQPDDERALTRLAQLDSARVPPAPLLVGLERGELRVAISLATGAAIADPFAPTARLVELLRVIQPPLSNVRRHNRASD